MDAQGDDIADDAEILKPMTEGVSARKKFKRQNTKTILETVKTRGFDAIDDMAALESITVGNYLYYFKSLGVLGILSAVLFYILCQIFEIGSKVWLAAWTSQATAAELNEAHFEEESHFVFIYGTLGLCQAVAYLAAVLQVNNRTISASKSIHNDVFRRVIFSKMEFIWTTPVGAVANRFSRDMNELDLVLPNTLKNFMFQVGVDICPLQMVSIVDFFVARS